LQYHNEHNRVFLFKCYWYDTTNKGIRVDTHHDLVEINSKARLHNVDDVFVFTKQCKQVYYIYTPSFRNDRSRVGWLSVLKTKPRGRVEVVQDGNDESNIGDDVFQLGELVDPYRVALSIDLEEKSNFNVTGNIFIDVDAKELNVVFSSNGLTQVNEDDYKDEIVMEDCDGNDDELIDEKKDNSN